MKSCSSSMLRYLIVTLILIFVALKLLGVITWSWWLVFSPVIAYAAFIIILLVFSFAMMKHVTKANL